jgi:ABC-2 type transport system permease protein
VNWAHFRAFAWLRWRLMVNQTRRYGALNAALMIVAVGGALTMVIPMFVGGFIAATYLIPKAPPSILMYVWDCLCFFFLLFWAIGLLTELHRNDPLSLAKFLHMPVSVRGAFLINYASSIIRLSLVMLGPAMLAFALALVYVKGIQQLAAPFLLAAFLLMVTAITYQFQGWLASLMSNPRRRRTVIVGTTISIVLIFQLPNLLNIYYTPRITQRNTERIAAQAAEQKKLTQELAARKIDDDEYQRRVKDLSERLVVQQARENREDRARLEQIVRIGNIAIPPCWLPLGVMLAAEGRGFTPWLCVAGMTLIGSASLWGAYRTTLAQFRGQASSRKPRGKTPSRVDPTGRPRRVALVEARLPWVSEAVSAVAMATLRSLIRAPEAKMALLMPLIMGAILGSILLQGRADMPVGVRPLFGFAAIAFVLFGLLQLMGNQFGVDRDGFRFYVLCAAPRREILFGKNLCFLPIAFVTSVLLLAGVQFACPMRLDHAVAMLPQFVSMYLLFCAMANLFSILAPYFIAAGSLKAATPKFSTIVLTLVMFFFLFPIGQGLTLLPLAVEAGLNAYGIGGGVPICLLMSIVECAGVVVFYHFSLGWLGDFLQAREQKILEQVTNRAS